MSRTNNFANGIFKLIFNNVSLSNIGDAGGLQPSATVGNFYLALYTTNPTKSTLGTESSYTGYSRVAIIRNSSNWTVGTVEPIQVSNTSDINFPSSTSSETIVGVGLLTAATGGDLLYFTTFASSLSIVSGSTPRISAGQIKFIDI